MLGWCVSTFLSMLFNWVPFLPLLSIFLLFDSSVLRTWQRTLKRFLFSVVVVFLLALFFVYFMEELRFRPFAFALVNPTDDTYQIIGNEIFKFAHYVPVAVCFVVLLFSLKNAAGGKLRNQWILWCLTGLILGVISCIHFFLFVKKPEFAGDMFFFELDTIYLDTIYISMLLRILPALAATFAYLCVTIKERKFIIIPWALAAIEIAMYFPIWFRSYDHISSEVAGLVHGAYSAVCFGIAFFLLNRKNDGARTEIRRNALIGVSLLAAAQACIFLEKQAESIRNSGFYFKMGFMILTAAVLSIALVFSYKALRQRDRNQNSAGIGS